MQLVSKARFGKCFPFYMYTHTHYGFFKSIEYFNFLFGGFIFWWSYLWILPSKLHSKNLSSNLNSTAKNISMVKKCLMRNLL